MKQLTLAVACMLGALYVATLLILAFILDLLGYGRK